VLALLEDPAGFDLLHFAGHGLATSDDIADAQVLLEGQLEQGDYVPEPLRATLVAQYFAAEPQAQQAAAPMVVLNACQTGRLGYQLASIGGFAEAFVGRGAGAFVSSLWSVGDSPARVFIQALYDALLAGESMASAVKTARETARSAGDATWLAYTVYAHPEARLYREPAATGCDRQ
jgi:CHAT domain-containing protein